MTSGARLLVATLLMAGCFGCAGSRSRSAADRSARAEPAAPQIADAEPAPVGEEPQSRGFDSSETPQMDAAPAESSEFTHVRVFYGTDRDPDKDVDPRREPNRYYSGISGELAYGFCDVSIPVVHEYGEVERPRLNIFFGPTPWTETQIFI